MLRRAMMAGGGSGPAVPAYKFIRIHITENNNDPSYTGIGECVMASTAGGAQQAAGGTARASSQFTTGSGAAYQAFDGDTTGASNGWVTSADMAIPSWLEYEFPAAKQIVELRMFNQVNQYTRVPKAFVVRGSNNGSTWTDIKSFSGVTGWANQVPEVFSLYD